VTARSAKIARDLDPTEIEINKLWCGDISFIRTWEGWLYVATVIDIASQRVVGWAMADHMRSELVSDALQMALDHRRRAVSKLNNEQL